jgi:hypothetical protein
MRLHVPVSFPFTVTSVCKKEGPDVSIEVSDRFLETACAVLVLSSAVAPGCVSRTVCTRWRHAWLPREAGSSLPTTQAR